MRNSAGSLNSKETNFETEKLTSIVNAKSVRQSSGSLKLRANTPWSAHDAKIALTLRDNKTIKYKKSKGLLH